MWLFAIIAFIIEIALSYVANRTNIAVISRKPKKVIFWSLLTTGLGRGSLLIMGGLSDWNLLVLIASALGDTLGDWLAASRKPRKKKYLKRSPVMTA